MASLAADLLSFPPDEAVSDSHYDEAIRKQLQLLGALRGSDLAGGAGTEHDLLELLNPEVNSIAYLYVVLARIQTLTHKRKDLAPELQPGGYVWLRAVALLEGFDRKQIRYAGQEWRGLVETVASFARLQDSPELAVLPIQSAMLRLDPTTGVFTSTHLLFIRLCHEARLYGEALPILDNYIHAFPGSPLLHATPLPCSEQTPSSQYITERSGLSERIKVEYVHEYFYLGAIAYIALRQWERALEYLEQVLVSPTQGAASGLMLEAYRKYVLVGCLLEGKLPSQPRAASGNALKILRLASKAYDALAEIFQSRDQQKFLAEVEAGQEIWQAYNEALTALCKDANTGLVRELAKALPRFVVLELQKIYAAVPLTQVASHLGQSPDTVMEFLDGLISRRELNARIDFVAESNKPAVLRFFADTTAGPLARSEAQQEAALVAQIARTQGLAEYVKAADQRLALSKEYIEYNRKRREKSISLPEGDQMEWAATGDEDLMGDD